MTFERSYVIPVYEKQCALMHIRWHKYSNATEKATACTYYFILFKGAVGNIKKYLYYQTDLTELGFMTAQGFV